MERLVCGSTGVQMGFDLNHIGLIDNGDEYDDMVCEKYLPPTNLGDISLTWDVG
jgi:hypothetical protein